MTEYEAAITAHREEIEMYREKVERAERETEKVFRLAAKRLTESEEQRLEAEAAVNDLRDQLEIWKERAAITKSRIDTRAGSQSCDGITTEETTKKEKDTRGNWSGAKRSEVGLGRGSGGGYEPPSGVASESGEQREPENGNTDGESVSVRADTEREEISVNLHCAPAGTRVLWPDPVLVLELNRRELRGLRSIVETRGLRIEELTRERDEAREELRRVGYELAKARGEGL